MSAKHAKYFLNFSVLKEGGWVNIFMYMFTSSSSIL